MPVKAYCGIKSSGIPYSSTLLRLKEAPQNHTCSIALPFRLLAINIYFPQIQTNMCKNTHKLTPSTKIKTSETTL